jgi:hypothetical protein
LSGANSLGSFAFRVKRKQRVGSSLISNLKYVLQILLVVGVFINLVKGADLILRPHQQKWLQEQFESLALWLDYTRPLRFYKDTRRHMYHQFYVVSPFVLLCWLSLMLYVIGLLQLWGVIGMFAITIWQIISSIKMAAALRSF